MINTFNANKEKKLYLYYIDATPQHVVSPNVSQPPQHVGVVSVTVWVLHTTLLSLSLTHIICPQKEHTVPLTIVDGRKYATTLIASAAWSIFLSLKNFYALSHRSLCELNLTGLTDQPNVSAQSS